MIKKIKKAIEMVEKQSGQVYIPYDVLLRFYYEIKNLIDNHEAKSSDG